MLVHQLRPLPNLKYLFDGQSLPRIPCSSGCYILATFDDKVLYVGQAMNLKTRFEQHLHDPVKARPTHIGKVTYWHALDWNATELNSLERAWLNAHLATEGVLPILNCINAPI
ncbi:GIY-YIG nuclease family protein [bacterium]|nr:GIY-YIG nuclease family protein [bacterium]